MQPMQRMAASKSRRRWRPQTVTRHDVGRMRPTSIRMVVVLPAPFGPRKPKTSPRRSSNETLSTMVRSPMTFVRFAATSATGTGSITFACVIVSGQKRGSWYLDRPMRRALYWFVPMTAAAIAAVLFAAGFVDYLRGDVGEPVTLAPRTTESTPPRGILSPLVLGDSLARGAGDSSGLGIGGRLLDELHHRRIHTRNVANIAINGARTADVLQQLESHNVQEVVAQANVIVLSIGGNDLWTDANWRAGVPRNPERVMTTVLDRVDRIVRTMRDLSPRARIFVIGL